MTRLAVMIRCLRNGRLLQRYLDEELCDADVADRVARHVAECGRCGLHARTLSDLKRSLGSGLADLDRPAIGRLTRFHRSLRDDTRRS